MINAAKPRLSLLRIIEMNIGFFGLQFSFGLQQANMGPIYGFLGADEATMPLLWLAGPMTGLIVQPIVGALSDRTSSRLGRRTPYFLIGAILFGYFLTITQTPQKVTNFLLGLELGAYPTLLLILAFMLVLGCVLDAMAMIILMIPILYPVVLALGFDPIWFGVIIVMTVELGLITPPIGMNVFVINTLARDVSLPTIYRGVLPFVATDIIRLGLLIAFPWVVMWLPNTMQ